MRRRSATAPPDPETPLAPQDALIDLGRLALVAGLDTLLARAAEHVATLLDVRQVAVLQLVTGDEPRLVLRAGTGWGNLVGQSSVPAGPGSLGERLLTDQPRVVDLDGGERPGWLVVQSAVRALSIAIGGDGGPVGALVVFSPRADELPREAGRLLQVFAAFCATIIRHKQAEEELRANEWRLAEAQQLAHLGSYDWDIRTDTNIWSDELYRIYGTEPQSFNASYDKFLSFIHPDDREEVVAIHRRAYEDHQPYQMTERIVRPDGTVRILESTGKVIVDERGLPVRMVGICMDVTERKEAELALHRSVQRFASTIASAPDAVLVMTADGAVGRANQAAERLFACETLTGKRFEDLLPGLALRPEADGEVLRTEAQAARSDGSRLFVDVSVGAIRGDEGSLYVAFVRDATERRRAEEARIALREADMRRRQALEINDNVVQGLAALIYALEAGFTDMGLRTARGILGAAQTMMGDLLGAGTIAAGDLLRERPAPRLLPEAVAPLGPFRPAGTPIRVLIADDAEDIRFLLRVGLESRGLHVIGEAANGRDALRMSEAERPDVIVLDLAMPHLDGLEAIPRLRALAPDVSIVVLSGFAESRMRQRALDAGADAYVEKGSAMAGIADLIVGLRPDLAGHLPALPPDPEIGEPPRERGSDQLAHELRTPLTVIQGLVATLRDRSEALPSSVAAEVLESIDRNAKQMRSVLEAFAEAEDLGAGRVELHAEPVDLVALVRDATVDVKLVGHRLIQVRAPEHVVVYADPVRVRQIVANLLSNALKFSLPDAPIEVDVRLRDGLAEVSVTDHGAGVAPERVGELFRKFSRLDAGRPGMGLGLFISRGLARAHGGDITHEQPPRDGARFVLRLPMESREALRTGPLDGGGAGN